MRYRSRGQSLVETALLLPVFVVLLLGIIDFGWYLYNYSALENAARRGSEQASKEPPRPANVANSADGCVAEINRQAALNLVLIDLPASEITLSYVNPALGRKFGSPIEVRIQHTGQFLTPLFGIVGVDDFDLDFRSRRSIMNTSVFLDPSRCP